MILKKLCSISFLFFFLSASVIYTQQVDISGALKSIEFGKLEEAQNILQRFKESNPANPDVIFLDAILTKNAEEAIQKYSTVFDKHPKNKYADVSLYRVFSYYYSLGLYKKAEGFFKRLKIDYPSSPYIAAADRKIPDLEEPAFTQLDSVKAASASNNAKFTIQAGAFLSLDNAVKLKDQLTNEGFITEIVNRVVGGSLLKVVTTGKFTSESDAKNALSKIENKLKLKGRIIPIQVKP